MADKVKGADLDADEFETKMLKGIEDLGESVGSVSEEVKAVDTKAETLLKNYDQLDVKTKGLMEDLTKQKKIANDQQANMDGLALTLKKLDAQLRREERQAFGNPIDRVFRDEEKKARFEVAVRKAIGAPLSDRHKEAMKSIGKALGEDTSPGSTVIDDALAQDIYDTLATFGVWNTFDVRQLSTRDTKYPVQTVRVVANAILTEGSAVADDANKAGTSVTLTVEVVAALLLVSEQLLEDAEIPVEPGLLAEFAEAYANRLDHFCLNAAGAANGTDGGMTGIFQGGTASVGGAGDVSLETSEFEDVTATMLVCDPVVLNRNSKWWIHPQLLVRFLHIKDSNGRPIFLTAIEAPAHGNIGSILGYGVVPAFAAPSTNTVNSKVAAFGDPMGLAVGIRRDFRFEQSKEFAFNTLQRAFRGWGRSGTKIKRAQAFGVMTMAAA